MDLESIKFELYSEETGRVPYEAIGVINFWEGTVELEINENGDTKVYDMVKFKILRCSEMNDMNGNPIFEGNKVHQVGTVTGCDIDFTGEVKFYDGTWYIDNGSNAVELFNECCENYIIVG